MLQGTCCKGSLFIACFILVTLINFYSLWFICCSYNFRYQSSYNNVQECSAKVYELNVNDDHLTIHFFLSKKKSKKIPKMDCSIDTYQQAWIFEKWPLNRKYFFSKYTSYTKKSFRTSLMCACLFSYGALSCQVFIISCSKAIIKENLKLQALKKTSSHSIRNHS